MYLYKTSINGNLQQKLEMLRGGRKAIFLWCVGVLERLRMVIIGGLYNVNNLLILNIRVAPYKSLDEITALRFHEIKYENDVTKVDKNWHSKKKYSENTKKKLKNYWLNLQDHYFELIKDQKPKTELRKQNRKVALMYEINIMQQVINALSFLILNKKDLPLSAFNGFITQLSSSVKKISPSLIKKDTEDVFKWMERMRLYTEGLITRHNLSKEEIKEVRESNFSDFYREKAYLELALEKNYISEDVKMTEWVVYKNQVQIKLQNNGK